jgi:hypothetical protein
VKRRKRRAGRADTEADGLTPAASYFASDDARARWLFDFLRTDLSTLTEGQALGLRKDAFGFIGAATIDAPEATGDRPTLTRDGWERLYGSLIPAEELPRLQTEIRAGLDRLQRRQWWQLEGRIGYGVKVMGSRVIRDNRRGQFRDLFVAAAIDVIQETWPRLRTCPQCGAPFLRFGKQAYCTPTCSQQARWKRYVDHRPKRDYRGERTRAIRNRIGPNARITPKRRNR